MSNPIRRAFHLVAVAVALLGTLPAAAHASHNGRANWHLGDRAPLKRGMSGQDIRVMQDYLTRAGHRTTVDGRFGRGTERAVRRFERDQDRRPTGALSRTEIRLLRRVVEDGRASRNDASEEAQAPEAPAGSKATIGPDGKAVAPADAPEAVKQIIAAGNEIADKPYRYGGGHGDWEDSGYDCSGSMSYALHGAGLLDEPLDSSGFMSYGEAGRGRWVTIYAHGGHAYMMVAGLRFDTSGRAERGTRWAAEGRSTSGYTVRHPPGL